MRGSYNKEYSDKYRKQEYVKEKDKSKYEARVRVIRDLKEKPCQDCGKQYPYYVMDFDHVRGEKLFDVSRDVPVEKRLKEIEKCDLVCANCHRERTFQKGQYNRSTQGSERWALKAGENQRVKDHCPQGHEYSEKNTYIHINKQGVKRRHCRICKYNVKIIQIQKNKEHYTKYNREYTREYRKRKKQQVLTHVNPDANPV